MMMLLSWISLALVALLLLGMLARVRSYRRLEKPGRLLASPYLALLQRIRLFRWSLLSIGTALAFGLAARWMTPSVAGMVGAFALIILCMPVRLTLTTEGAAVGESAFYPWKEFRLTSDSNGRLDIRHAGPLGRITLHLSSAESGSVAKSIRRSSTPADTPSQ